MGAHADHAAFVLAPWPQAFAARVGQRLGACFLRMKGGGMGKKKKYRKGSGELRSRWDPRGVSNSVNQPQAVVRDEPPQERSHGKSATRVSKLEALADRRFGGLVVVLEDIADVYNCGAALRSCEAFGVTEVWLVHNGIEAGTSMRGHLEREEPFDVDSRKMKESSASAARWVTTRTWFSSGRAAEELAAGGFRQLAVVASGDVGAGECGGGSEGREGNVAVLGQAGVRSLSEADSGVLAEGGEANDHYCIKYMCTHAHTETHTHTQPWPRAERGRHRQRR